jgi:copper(I)-binding protein
VPAGGVVELKPGGYHIMLIDLVMPLEAGEAIELTLTFQSGAVVNIMAVVGDGPMPMGSPAPAA